MSFNTSNISCDSLLGVYNVSAPVHLVDGIPISKNGSNLKLGNSDNAVVECLEMQVGTQMSAPIGTISSVVCDSLLPTAGTTGYVQMGGNLDLNGYEISNLNTLTLAGGLTGATSQVLAVNSSGNLYWKNDAQGDVSQWSTFSAVQDVDLDGYSLLNGLTGDFQNLNIQKTDKSAQFNLSYGNSTSEPTLPALLINPPVQYGYVSLLNSCNFEIVGAGSLNIPNGNISCPTVFTNTLNTQDGRTPITIYTDVTSSRDATFNGISGGFIQSPSIQFGNYSSQSLLNISNGSNDILSQSTANLTGFGNVSCAQLLPTFKLNYDYFVSPNGNDSTGNGSMENPFATIQHCIGVCETLTTSDNTYRYIHITSGSYTENLTISKKVYLVGEAQSPYTCSIGCQINGNLSINVNANGSDMFNNCVNIMGLQINGNVVFTSTNNSILNIENTYIYTPNDSSGSGVYFNPSATNGRLRLWNSQIISGGATGTNPLVELTNSGSLTMNNCYLSAKGLQNCLKFSGTATCDTVNMVKFECSNSGANVSPLVEITATASATYSFGNCAFFYSSNTSKSSNSSACGILNNNASGNNNILINYCSFFLLGTSSSLNYAVQDANYGTATAMVVLYYMNNASLTNAFAIHAILNTNKFQLQTAS